MRMRNSGRRESWCAELRKELGPASMAAEGLVLGFRELTDRIETDFQAADFGFLFDEVRQVLRLGYNVGSGVADPNHYDLIASEARIASLLAIAKGDAPQSHWLHLGRPVILVDGRRALLSWNGSMFEYLMPALLLRTYPGTLLGQTSRTVVRRQIRYGRQKDVPWGISESSYYRFDAGLNYQYRGFGVPGLGIKRGLGDDLVVAPYASLLALPFEPQAVVRNLHRLRNEGMLGRLRPLRSQGLHPGSNAPGTEQRDRVHLHGSSPGHDHALSRELPARQCHGPEIPRRSPDTQRGVAAAGTGSVGGADRGSARRRDRVCRTRPNARGSDAVVGPRGRRIAPGALPFERDVRGHDLEHGLRVQLLGRVRRDPLALRSRLRRVGHVDLLPRAHHGCALVRRFPADRCCRR